MLSRSSSLLRALVVAEEVLSQDFVAGPRERCEELRQEPKMAQAVQRYYLANLAPALGNPWAAALWLKFQQEVLSRCGASQQSPAEEGVLEAGRLDEEMLGSKTS